MTISPHFLSASARTLRLRVVLRHQAHHSTMSEEREKSLFGTLIGWNVNVDTFVMRKTELAREMQIQKQKQQKWSEKSAASDDSGKTVISTN